MKLSKFSIIFFLSIFSHYCHATTFPDDNILKKQIGQMLIVGFDGESVDIEQMIL